MAWPGSHTSHFYSHCFGSNLVRNTAHCKGNWVIQFNSVPRRREYCSLWVSIPIPYYNCIARYSQDSYELAQSTRLGICRFYRTLSLLLVIHMKSPDEPMWTSERNIFYQYYIKQIKSGSFPSSFLHKPDFKPDLLYIPRAIVRKD